MEKNPEVFNLQNRIFPALVAQVINPSQLVINRGSLHGVKVGQRMLIYRTGDQEIKDPESGESLGYLELVKGTGKVIHVQEKICTIESDKKKAPRRIIKNSWGFPEEDIIEGEALPFDQPEVGDLVKPI
ncbi:hypothetical protein NG799_29310 [Laspinema sp. D1]|uniref:Uncharacterized protein n=1 Tax=Laspinema palackyanum D2a TaxID=2953684 RepID=A0ABT2N3X5_9CYAN|nr:hypothetical protein [Laspinema sp. D2d]MCT7970416.1 hypothetical protein [Laspinema sp. D2a]MCT7983911.1 hypothetical protein [Laspinema sp. D2d]